MSSQRSRPLARSWDRQGNLRRSRRSLNSAEPQAVLAGTSEPGIVVHDHMRAGFALVPVSACDSVHDFEAAAFDAIRATDDGSRHDSMGRGICISGCVIVARRNSSCQSFSLQMDSVGD